MAEIFGTGVTVGVGIETTEGSGVQSQNLLDCRSYTVYGRDEKLYGQALRGRLARRALPGASYVDGSLDFELTPEGGTARLLYAAIGDITTTNVGAIYTHVMKPLGGSPRAITLVQKTGDVQPVCGGCIIDTMDITMALDDIVVGTATVGGHKEVIFASGATTTAGGAAFDGNDPFVFTRANVKLYGSTSTDVDNVTINFANNIMRKQALRDKRFSLKHLWGASAVTGSLSMYFSSDAEHKAFFGNASLSAPYQSADQADFVDLEFILRSTLISGSDYRTLTIDFPKSQYDTLEAPVTSPDAIRQDLTFTALVDGTSNEPTVTIINTDSGTLITGAGSAISGWPAD